MDDVNSMYFSGEDLKKGLHLRLIKALLDLFSESSAYYCDIHIKPEDADALVVEWVQRSWDEDLDLAGRFEYLGDGESVYKELAMPDGSYEEVPKSTDESEYVAGWLKENPGYSKDRFGVWHRDGGAESGEKAKGKAEGTDGQGQG